MGIRHRAVGLEPPFGDTFWKYVGNRSTGPLRTAQRIPADCDRAAAPGLGALPVRLVVAAVAALGCAACGFKGPLYLPQQNAAAVTHPAAGTRVGPASSTATRRKADHQGNPPGNSTPN